MDDITRLPDLECLSLCPNEILLLVIITHTQFSKKGKKKMKALRIRRDLGKNVCLVLAAGSAAAIEGARFLPRPP